MKIISSAVSLSSQQTNITSSSRNSHLKMWDTTAETPKSASVNTLPAKQHLTDNVQIDQNLLDQSLKDSETAKKDKNNIDKYLDEFYGDIRLKIFKELVEKFTGKEIKVYNPEEDANTESAPTDTSLTPAENVADSAGTQQLQGWGLDFSYQEINYSLESFSVEAAGKVVTENGREITFSTSLSMNRETYEEFSVSLKAGDALIDPLMIDFSGTGAKLSNYKFDFDLNFDGTVDPISAPSSGAGFLAYDKNGDGYINDGTELFGPSTNDGFGELATFDSDKNGWIDENDPIFNNLKIWEINSDGNSSLAGLLDKNVGAIYTGRVDTSFNLLDESKQLNGKLRQSGIWLNEKSGQAGVIQEIDLVI